MDGGSGLNIIFADMLRRMNKPVEHLPKSANTFHGIVPGKAVLTEGVMAMRNASRVIFPSGRVPGSASEPSRTRVDDGGGVGDFRGIVLGCFGFSRSGE